MAVSGATEEDAAVLAEIAYLAIMATWVVHVHQDYSMEVLSKVAFLVVNFWVYIWALVCPF